MREFLKKLLFPHGACLFFLVLLSVTLLIYRFTNPDIPEAVEYVAYILSAYTLTALCCRLPTLVRFFQTLGQKNKYLTRYQNDARWRLTLSLYSSFSVNCTYALLQFGLGVYHTTIWYYSMAAYYLMLAVMRFYLLGYTKKHAPGENRKKEWCRYRFCGVILVGMNLTLAVIVFYITWQNRTFFHHMITTIAMAAYTFTAFTMAVVNLIRYRKYKSPVFSAAKVIGLVAAMVSMLTLETTMLTVFGKGETGDFNRVITGTTGAVVTLTVLVMAVYMIVKSTGELKRQDNNMLT